MFNTAYICSVDLKFIFGSENARARKMQKYAVKRQEMAEPNENENNKPMAQIS